MMWRLFIEALWQWPWQQVMDDARQVQVGEVTEPRDFAQIRHQPVFEAFKQCGVADIRPFTLVLTAEVQLT
ncbi:hypothetical protein D3C85_348280 [compost metagenome]